MRLLIIWALVAVAFSGCVSEPVQLEPVVIEEPDDYSYLQEPSPGGHVHDYWRGADSILLLDTSYGARNGPVYNGPVKTYQKLPDFDEGVVVPQGTSHLAIKVELNSTPLSMYQNGEVMASTPADRDMRVLGPVGESFEYKVSAEEADLPHAQISGWEFWMRFDGEHGMYLYDGSVSMSVEAFRGDGPLPVFPDHPDVWSGRSEYVLFDRSIEASYIHYDPIFDGCSGINGCTNDISPDAGVLVPPGADHIDVLVSSAKTAPTAMALTYHGADSYEYTEAEVIDESDGRLYRIQVGTRGDSPYAETSLWEFRFRPDNNVAVGEFQAEATVYRYPEPGPEPIS